MNKQIRKLAKQSGIKFIPMIVDGIEYEYEDIEMDGSDDLQKFAKAIVKECAEIVRNSHLPDAYSEPCLQDIADELEEHFGVE